MRKIIISVLFLLGIFIQVDAQQMKRPKLVVGIVVDQMREEFLYRFYDQYGENGFKRLMREGFNCRNMYYNYVPTYTGPGHSSVYSGTTPAFHGIVSNDWYDRKLKRMVYCVEDSMEQFVGTAKKTKGASPRRLLSTNISDELKISTNGKANVIGISLKDRAAILPAGHLANGAYWFDQSAGNFISSTFYMRQLPDWVKRFNDEKKADKYLDTWTLLRPEKDYPFSASDDNDYEGKFKGKEKPVFPYNLKELSVLNPPLYSVLYTSPFGNSILTDFAIETIKNESLGKDDVTDLLAISYSSPDAIGHKFGPLSKELNDTYLRLDEDIARLLVALDESVGQGNYTVFLTADHGDVDPPKYLKEHNIPAGFLDPDTLKKEASDFLNNKLGKGKWIESFCNDQFYLDHKLISEKNMNLIEIENQLADFLRGHEGIAQVVTANQIINSLSNPENFSFVQLGFYYKRCGDVFLITEPGWIDELNNASTHGTGYSYDTNVPLIFYGTGINKGESLERYSITDIAPTISMLLHIKLPGGCIGNPIIKAIGEKNALLL